MNFEEQLSGKILDPIHGTIRITDVECKVINHKLFQRLRNVKQNTFLYKVFPSAMHSRFEHSLGVMHVAYKMLDNLVLNSYRYKSKYHDELLFKFIGDIPCNNIQELRLAALLHDVGHGPMSHQFDSFMLTKIQLQDALGKDFNDVYKLINSEKGVEHEHISLIFIKKILSDLNLTSKVNVDNVIKIIESKYLDSKVVFEKENVEYDLLPLFTSLISSCPIDSDRMDYLLRDSYFSGVKCGIYNVERILMSIVPVVDENKKVCLAYKESSLDSISEFIFSRSNLFSQVYYHKTNRAFSAMLSKVCELSISTSEKTLANKMFPDGGNIKSKLEKFQEFYIHNSDDHFINNTIPELIEESSSIVKIVDDIVARKPWKKLYESKTYDSNVTIMDMVDGEYVSRIKNSIAEILKDKINSDSYVIDIMSDNAFKDVDKTEIKLLIKDIDGNYISKPIEDSGEKLNRYQSIRYFIRLFVDSNCKLVNKKEVLKQIDCIVNA